MSDLSQWFKSLPIFTRHWLGFTLAFTILGRFGIFKYSHLTLDYSKFIHSFQIWRPITALFYYPLSPATGFHFLINCFFLYNYSLRLETGHFRRSPADYCFMLLFNWACCVIVGLLGEIQFLMDPMVLSVLCVWCQLNPNVIVNFWFGAQFKAMYLPWVLFGVNLIISGGGILELVGILVGHLYLFLTVTLPRERGGPSLLTTPAILYKWFPNEGGNVSGFGEPPVNRRSATAGGGGGTRHTWGTGHVLGQN